MLVDRFGRPLSAPFGSMRGFMHKKGPALPNGAIYAHVTALNLTSGTTRYFRPFLGGTGGSTAEEPWIVPFDCTLHRWYMKAVTPGSGDAGVTQTFDFLKNGVSVKTLGPIATNTSPYELEDLVAEVAFSAGDRLTFTTINSGTITGTAPTNVTMSCVIKP